MSRRARIGAAAVLLAALAGCPAPEDRAAPEPSELSTSVPAPAPTLSTDATTDLPAYGGPPPGGPPSAGPLTRPAATVDLTPATPTVFSVPDAMVAAPDGRVLVVVSPVDHSAPRLATVAPAGDGYAVTGAVELPPFYSVTDVHVLPDGRAAVVGEVDPVGDTAGGFGVAIVDPATGAARTTVAVPFDPQDVFAVSRSALSADGGTLYLLISCVELPEVREELIAVDVGTGQVVGRRALDGDIAQVSLSPAGLDAVGLVPRPGGGITLLLEASPVTSRPEHIPTLLPFAADLAPDGEPVRLTDLTEGAEVQAVTVSADGSVFVVVEVRDDVWVLAVPDGGGAGPVLAVLDDPAHDHSLVVEPAEEWALLPALRGARAVNLRTGEQPPPLDLGCGDGLHVRSIRPGATGAVLIGECGPIAQRTAMLWLAAP